MASLGFAPAIIANSQATARVLGFPDGPDGIPSSMVEEAMQSTREAHVTPEAAHIPSTLLDIEKGRPIEVEVIWGELIRTAKARGIDMPVSWALSFEGGHGID